MPDTSIERFRRVVAAASRHLEARRQEVNDLNVFPVADGDTGDNMVLTLRAVVAQLDRLSGADGTGVVDAGGYGLTLVMAGVVAALRGTDAPQLEHHRAPARITHPQHESSTYRY